MRDVSLKFLIYFKSKYFPQVLMKAKTPVWASPAFYSTSTSYVRNRIAKHYGESFNNISKKATI